MEQLEESYEQSFSYPKNLLRSDVPAPFLEEIFSEFSSQASRLFCDDESKAVVELLERPHENEGARLCNGNPGLASWLTYLKAPEIKRCHNADALHKALWSPMFKESPKYGWRMM